MAQIRAVFKVILIWAVLTKTIWNGAVLIKMTLIAAV
jgi:hypothetical protein